MKKQIQIKREDFKILSKKGTKVEVLNKINKQQGWVDMSSLPN